MLEANKQLQYYWQYSSRLVLGVVLIWFILSMVIPALVNQLNQLVFLTFPLGFYMAAQGSLIGFIWLIFWYNRNQVLIDQMVDCQEENSCCFSASLFTEKLSKFCRVYVGGFLCFVLLMALLEQIGVSTRNLGYIFVAFTILVHGGIGMWAPVSGRNRFWEEDY